MFLAPLLNPSESNIPEDVLVATLGLLPAALSHAIGSDSQRPFAIVIVGGLTVDLVMSTFLLPAFYVWWARPTDWLPSPDQSRSVYDSGPSGPGLAGEVTE